MVQAFDSRVRSFDFGVSEFESRAWGFRFGFPSLVFLVSSFGYRVLILGHRVPSFEFLGAGLDFGASSLGILGFKFRVKDLGFRVPCLRFRGSSCRFGDSGFGCTLLVVLSGWC